MKPIYIVLGVVVLAAFYFLFLHKPSTITTVTSGVVANSAGSPSLTTQLEGAAIKTGVAAATGAITSYFSSDDTGDF